MIRIPNNFTISQLRIDNPSLNAFVLLLLPIYTRLVLCNSTDLHFQQPVIGCVLKFR